MNFSFFFNIYMSIVQSKTVRISHLKILKVKTKLPFFFFYKMKNVLGN